MHNKYLKMPENTPKLLFHLSCVLKKLFFFVLKSGFLTTFLTYVDFIAFNFGILLIVLCDSDLFRESFASKNYTKKALILARSIKILRLNQYLKI